MRYTPLYQLVPSEIILHAEPGPTSMEDIAKPEMYRLDVFDDMIIFRSNDNTPLPI